MLKRGIRVQADVRLTEARDEMGALRLAELRVEARRRELRLEAQERLNAVLYPVGAVR